MSSVVLLGEGWDLLSQRRLGYIRDLPGRSFWNSEIWGNSLALYPGQTVAQLFFHDVDVDERDAKEEMGQYSGVVDLVPRRISGDATYGKLTALKKLRQ